MTVEPTCFFIHYGYCTVIIFYYMLEIATLVDAQI